MEFDFENKALNNIFRILKYVGFIAVIIIMIWFTPSHDELHKQWLKEIAHESFQGEVTGMFVDKSNHNTHSLMIKGDSIRGYPEELEYRIAIGDSLIKKRNETTLTIRKKNGKVIIWDYANPLNIKEK